MKHTPGPWAVLSHSTNTGHWTIHSLDIKAGGVVAETSGHFLGSVNANAALIASAPELLESLQDAITFISPEYGYDSRLAECLKKARTAILKATGES